MAEGHRQSRSKRELTMKLPAPGHRVVDTRTVNQTTGERSRRISVTGPPVSQTETRIRERKARVEELHGPQITPEEIDRLVPPETP